MIIETKYEVGDFVFPLSYRQFYKKIPNDCPVCDDNGNVHIRGRKYVCPECKGKENPDVLGDPIWFVDLKSKGCILSIKIKISDKVEIKYKLDTWSDEHSMYMKIWEESALFLSREEAELECLRRNYTPLDIKGENGI